MLGGVNNRFFSPRRVATVNNALMREKLRKKFPRKSPENKLGSENKPPANGGMPLRKISKVKSSKLKSPTTQMSNALCTTTIISDEDDNYEDIEETAVEIYGKNRNTAWSFSNSFMVLIACCIICATHLIIAVVKQNNSPIYSVHSVNSGYISSPISYIDLDKQSAYIDMLQSPSPTDASSREATDTLTVLALSEFEQRRISVEYSSIERADKLTRNGGFSTALVRFHRWMKNIHRMLGGLLKKIFG